MKLKECADEENDGKYRLSIKPADAEKLFKYADSVNIFPGTYAGIAIAALWKFHDWTMAGYRFACLTDEQKVKAIDFEFIFDNADVVDLINENLNKFRKSGISETQKKAHDMLVGAGLCDSGDYESALKTFLEMADLLRVEAYMKKPDDADDAAGE